uniref:AlNc14C5G696 protein n=1 Tax=Albugo laibachii Nc14 TaxID=890382 RepID=F0W0R1_9STRA|nr:AlNc14C5G696 [Albugo laibachii Nc14]|eukprot:CCA14635.1 AlNc14C5G696 [Albugo laibachii Nc14]
MTLTTPPNGVTSCFGLAAMQNSAEQFCLNAWSSMEQEHFNNEAFPLNLAYKASHSATGFVHEHLLNVKSSSIVVIPSANSGMMASRPSFSMHFTPVQQHSF